MTSRNSTTPPTSGKPAKPAKPTPDFPLYAHASGRWAKKIRGRLHYFGPWSDPDGALAKYLDQKDALHSGRVPADEGEALTVRSLCGKFLETKTQLRETGELSIHSFNDYAATVKRIIKAFGASRLVADLRPADFERLRGKLSKTWGVVRLGNEINRVRSVFRYAEKQGLLPRAVVFGEGFKQPSKSVMRKHRAAMGPRTFSPAEIRTMLDGAGQPLRSMILLGVNCGFGNSDIGNVPLAALDLDGGWMSVARPKTGIDRRCALWPQTVAALREWLDVRPAAKDPEANGGLLFLTSHGGTWAKVASDSPLSKEMKKLLKRLKIDGHRNFYGLRHSFQNAGDESGDFVATRHVMGHTMSGDIASNYRNRPKDDRLRAVAEHVRRWLFDNPAPTPEAEPQKDNAPSPRLRLYSA